MKKSPFEFEKDPFKVTHKGAANLYEVYLSEGIDSPEKYTKLVSFLRAVTPMDEVRFYINCPGGRLDTGLQLLNAINDCEGRVLMILDGEAYSMAAFLMFAGDEIHINDNAMLMIHNYSGGHAGKGGDLLNSAEAFNKLLRRMMKKYFTGFITDEEMENVLHGKDMYFDTEEIAERLERRKEYIENCAEEVIKAATEAGVFLGDEETTKAPAKKKSTVKKKAPVKKRVTKTAVK